MITRKLFCLCLAATMAMPFGVAVAQETFEFRLASFANDGDSFGQAQTKFAEELATRSGGRIRVSIFNNNSLGSNREAIEMATMNSVDFVVTGVSHATRYAPALDAVMLPYLWESREDMFEALDGETGDRLDGTLESQGLSIIGWWDNGFRHVSNNRQPITQPGDIAGLKLRTLPSAVQVEFFRQLGAIPTPMDFSELLPALRQGIIDGQENPPAVVYPYQIYEAQKYYSLTGHVNEPMLLLASDAAIGRLPDDLKTVVDEAAASASEFQRQLNDERTEELMAGIRAEMEVNEVPEETLAAFRKVAVSVYEKAYEGMGPEGEAIVRAILEKRSQ
ncbi:TRAP transporter substrate-binding protein [Hoeflea sp. BAL378]|uniref:TRAP transporter substrate-binding protein n=1 Tax=Hoeflea sp. BAL378 TaxID=1547437 RepID=UPI0009DEDF49|nr:TRAP transporter substrate-binding protein [Hoeflea sp. BAL378]